MAKVVVKVSPRRIKYAVKKNVTQPLIELSKNPEITRLIAQKALDIVEPYVPYKTGKLNESGRVVQHARQTKIIWGKLGIGRTNYYAAYQHDNIFRHRTRTVHPLAKSFWTKQIAPGSPGYRKLITYAKPLVKKEVKKNGR